MCAPIRNSFRSISPTNYTGWAVGESGLIVRTDDGGYSWQRLSDGGREDVNDLTFFNDEHRRFGRFTRKNLADQ